MEDFYKGENRKLRTKTYELETEIMKLKQEIRDLKRKNITEELNPQNYFSRKNKFENNHLKQQNKQKDIIILNLNKELNKLETDVRDYKEKFSKTLEMLTQCTNNEEINKEKLSDLKDKVEDLLETKEQQDIQIKKLRKYAKEKMVQIRNMEKNMKKESKKEEKEEQKAKKEAERKRKEAEKKAKKEAEEMKRKFEEEQRKKEQERIRREREAAQKVERERQKRKKQEEEDLKRRQKERVEEINRKKRQEKEQNERKSKLKENMEREILRIHKKIDLYTVNMFFNLGIKIYNLDKRSWRKLTLKYHPDRAINKSLHEQIKYEIIFNAINDFKVRVGGRKKKIKI